MVRAHVKAHLLHDSEEFYENPYRQSSVVPYRIGPDGIDVLMITSAKRKRWILPKGIVEPEMSPAMSAAKEALEEAGAEGDVSPESIGRYHYEKWGGACHCDVYPMRVTMLHEDWLERDVRSREWVAADIAIKRIRHKKLRAIVRKFIAALRETTQRHK